MKLRKIQEKRNKIQKRGKIEMRRKNRKPIASIKKLPQFTTMNVIDGQAGLENYSRLIFYSLTIDNILNIILNIIVLLILAGVTIGTITGENGIIKNALEVREKTEIANEKEIVEEAALNAMKNNKRGNIVRDELQEELDKIDYNRYDECLNADKAVNKNWIGSQDLREKLIQFAKENQL